jgi:colanic acid biosynthesis protein WcaH
MKPHALPCAFPLGPAFVSAHRRAAGAARGDRPHHPQCASEVLLGLRNNEPAKDWNFVPGGVILKNEPLREAFARILKRETNLTGAIDVARLLGVYEHFYPNNRFDEEGYGTHYVVLGYTLTVTDIAAMKQDDQHSKLCWWTEATLLASPNVHHNVKAYFRNLQPAGDFIIQQNPSV